MRRHIATGGMASVWCAEDGVLGRSVAIKILSDRFADDEAAVRRFMREARAAARVSNHPHVVTIYDVGDIEPEEGPSPRAFIVMEYLAGGTVADALRHQAVRREEACRWVSEAASALDHAHERGIVHRDIKPANFLLDQGRGLHVADFGIAHLQSEDTITSSGQLFGTAAYLAPEQALGKEPNGASDRYALAVAAFELLTGGRPFTATHFAAQARQHIEQAPPLASERDPSLPPAVDAVLCRGMAKDPADRYPTARAFTEELDAALASQPTAITEAVTAPTERQTQGRRHPGGALAAGALAAGAAVAGSAAETAPARGAARPAQVPARGGRPADAAGARGSAGPSNGRGNRRGGNGRNAPARPVAARARPRRGAALALVALGIVVLGVIVLLTQSGGSSNTSTSGHHRAKLAVSTSHHRATSHRKAVAATSASSSTTAAASSPAAASSSAAAGPVSPAPATGGDASALQLQGHADIAAGNYPAAITALQKAVATAPHDSLTYAYALYDLGDALLLSGNPRAAIPILQQRLQINNQTATVQALLSKAEQAAGQAPASGGSGGVAAGHSGHGHGKGGG